MSHSYPVVPLGHVASPVERPNAPIPGTLYRQVGVRLWGQGAYERESIDGGQTKYKTLSRVEANDIIVNKIWARNGSVAVVPGELSGCYVSGEFPTFTPVEGELAPDWFHWLTKTRALWNQCDEKSRGTSGKNRIRSEQFLSITIPLPPVDEQRRIVARIEELAAKIEEARELRRQSSSEAQQLFMATADAEMNRLAKDYPTAKVSDIEDLVTSGPRNFGSRYTQSGPRFYRAQDISPSGRVTDDNIVQVEIPEGMSTRAVVREGDVLVVITGATIGRSAVITPHLPAGLVSQHVGLIRVDRAKVEPQFLQYAMLSPAWAGGQLDEVKYGQGKPGLNLNNLRSLAFPLPPLYEQQQVVTHLNDLQAWVDVLTQLQVETAAELDALLPSVLDRAFSGEL